MRPIIQAELVRAIDEARMMMKMPGADKAALARLIEKCRNATPEYPTVAIARINLSNRIKSYQAVIAETPNAASVVSVVVESLIDQLVSLCPEIK